MPRYYVDIYSVLSILKLTKSEFQKLNMLIFRFLWRLYPAISPCGGALEPLRQIS